ncbi:hypothetical protein FA95DRAFT_1552927 [Auriscalpium vulgare]|uniref:Uncharacterized protein n=1 Tax=Auriscalpium vulgare TaxID=40419 RepID=A0ACB8S9P6_9AGAM|nr:hypothetical protein FA95DRAFT_1552927 [Auriscalpium vulgare]
MPVPVPCFSKATAHPVNKLASHPGDASRRPSVFHNLTQSLPLPPPGPPPSFGTREEWISSLPSWRRNKPRRIWEEDEQANGARHQGSFQPGLVNAGNASVIKGERAQACIPPSLTLIGNADQVNVAVTQMEGEGDADDEMSATSCEYDTDSQWSGQSYTTQDNADIEVEYDYSGGALAVERNSMVEYYDPPQLRPVYGHNAYTPVSDGMSPDPVVDGDPQSSPLGPVTPFGDFVDRAVETVFVGGGVDMSSAVPECRPNYFLRPSDFQTVESASYQQRQEDVDPVPDPTAAPTVTLSYKKIADPLADWVASYVWKACTAGMSLPSRYTRSTHVAPHHFSPHPPPYLANSIRSLLLSTLLQPSAIFLAVWYIVRLPVQFGRVEYGGAEFVKEMSFRAELLGPDEWQDAVGRETNEIRAPFRLVLLGCMLANKWLDDHTFSNKTWHTVSGVDIQSLNRLESLALDIFSHDLSVPVLQWAQWLQHVQSYHMSLSSLAYPQPISRPSSNPHSIVRKTIEELVEIAAISQIPRACGDHSCMQLHPQPVFLNLEERRRARNQPGLAFGAANAEVLEIDLDEDGPLRDEYVPRRGVSRDGSIRDSSKADSCCGGAEKLRDWERPLELPRYLPPPAKWSPAGDEPIIRDGRSIGQYVAVRAPLPHGPLLPPIQLYRPSPPTGVPQGWMAPPFSNERPLVPLHGAYPNAQLTMAHSHSRSTSLCDPPPSLISEYSHGRSYSQTHLEYACSDVRMTMQKAYPFPPELPWTGAEQYGYGASYGQNFGHDAGARYGPPWVRA